MKWLYFSVIIVCMCSAENAGARIDEVVIALKNGNAAQIARYFDQTVQIYLPDKSGSLPKGKAESTLKDFFFKNPVKEFQVIHAGQHTGSEYCIGTLLTRNGNYRTTIFMQQVGDMQVMQELRLESR